MRTLFNVVCFLTVSLGCFAAERPDHIVVVIADDHSAHDSTPYGSKLVDTPRMQRLADEGMVFDRAYVASPSCAPSRAALLTGLMSSRNGAMRNHVYPNPGTHYMTEDLKNAGFHVAAFGKVAHGRKGAEMAGFDYFNTAFLADESFMNRATKKPYDGKALQAVRTYMEEKSQGGPLCLFLGINDPHKPWTSSRDRYQADGKNFDVPYFIDSEIFREELATYYNEVDHVDHLIGEFRSMTKEILGDNVLFVYTADHGAAVPFGKWTLFEAGIRSPFIFSWPGKIRPGQRSDAMVSWVDLLPTLVDLSGGSVPEEIDGGSFVSVLLGEKDSHRRFIFASHVGDGEQNYSPSRSVNDGRWKYIRYLDGEYMFTTHQDLNNNRSFAPFHPEWVAVAEAGHAGAREIVQRYYLPAKEHLYDLESDPFEKNNLAMDQRFADIKSRLSNVLDEWMQSQGDDGVDEGSSFFKRKDAIHDWGTHSFEAF
ncbi:MAG: sulfatase [Opitutales bacterium]|nr:sulfatase [Opitutales bacterium]